MSIVKKVTITFFVMVGVCTICGSSIAKTYREHYKAYNEAYAKGDIDQAMLLAEKAWRYMPQEYHYHRAVCT